MLILLSNRALGSNIMEELEDAGVAYEPPRSEGFKDSEPGRMVLAALRLICEKNDYVAHRVLLGLRLGVGIATWRAPYSGLVLEAARLLYVSITRARASCVMSFARYRMVNGVNTLQTPSRFDTALAGAFAPRNSGLAPAEIQQIVLDRSQL